MRLDKFCEKTKPKALFERESIMRYKINYMDAEEYKKYVRPVDGIKSL